jgi:hypothetical protein
MNPIILGPTIPEFARVYRAFLTRLPKANPRITGTLVILQFQRGFLEYPPPHWTIVRL